MTPTRVQFQTWLLGALPGERTVYFTGDLMKNRVEGSHIDALATAAWDAHLAGTCVLVQRRLGPSQSEYIAIKTPPGWKKPHYVGAYEPDFLAGRVLRMIRLNTPRVTDDVTKAAA